MATHNGFLHNISGTMGNLVFSSYRGKQYVKRRPVRVKPPTPKQLAQQARFKLISSFNMKFKELFDKTLREKHKSPLNIAMSLNMPAVTGDYPDFKIDYSRITLCSGRLHNACVVVKPMHNVLTFLWNTDQMGYNALPSDKTILIAYCEDLNKAVFTIGGNERRKGRDKLNLKMFKGMEVQAWISFISETGEVASGLYAGSIII